MAYLQITMILLWHTVQLLGLQSQRPRVSNKQKKSTNYCYEVDIIVTTV